MTIAMPRVVQTPTHMFNPKKILHRVVYVHMSEGGSAGGVAWLCSGNVQASTHLFMNEDGTLVYELVPLEYEAWAQCAYNGNGISMEIPGFTAKGIPDARWRAAAVIVAWLCRAYAIPPVWARNDDESGIRSHDDLGARGGGHVDPCPVGAPVWLTFIGYVKEAYDAFGDGDLPAFALNGTPNPHLVSLPPAAQPEPSHGAKPRIADGAVPTPHDTVSGFAKGSMKDLQWRLRKVGANPMLDVDGDEGRATRSAFGAFQRAVGLPVTNDVNPPTLAKLYAMTAA